MMIEVREEIETYRSHFAQLEKSLEGGEQREPEWLHPMRKAAWERFTRQGFPSTNEEDWRFTSVVPLTQVAFQTAPVARREEVEELCNRARFRGWKGCELVFVNGRFVAEYSSLGGLPEGTIAGSLAEALRSHSEVAKSHLSRSSRLHENAFAALNTAFVEDGAFVFLPRDAAVEEPIHLIFLSSSGEQATLSHPRNLIVAGTNSQARIVETYAGGDGKTYFTNVVTEVVAGENATVDHYKLQREGDSAFHVASLHIRAARSANVSNHSISLGARLARNDIHCLLDGEGSECSLNGLYVVSGEQHVDHHTLIDHARPHCTSRELYKGILDGCSQAVFNGRIIVRPDAQKTDARQTNKNLLLSSKALVNTNPQLEINADDVKCAHGATIGQLDADALFYLRSRGIELGTARSLLTNGFMSDISNRIKIETIRSYLESVVFVSLPQGSG
ncbi:MAG: Fe-S cluster assembly protein SufD [Acidobacteriota bacterium]